MTASVQSPADIVNGALVRIGRKMRLGSLYDGTPASKAALDVYGQTRDQLLRDGDWDFARRDVSLTLLKTAPVGGYFPPTVWNPATNPPPPWIYEYQYNSDFLLIRSIKGVPLLIPDFDPQPVAFSVANDNNFTPARRVVLCNVASAIATYTAQVTDPTTMEPSFVEALIAALARRLAVTLADPKLLQAEAQDEGTETVIAETRRG
jgi:hypothetical protein